MGESKNVTAVSWSGVGVKMLPDNVVTLLVIVQYRYVASQQEGVIVW